MLKRFVKNLDEVPEQFQELYSQGMEQKEDKYIEGKYCLNIAEEYRPYQTGNLSKAILDGLGITQPVRKLDITFEESYPPIVRVEFIKIFGDKRDNDEELTKTLIPLIKEYKLVKTTKSNV